MKAVLQRPLCEPGKHGGLCDDCPCGPVGSRQVIITAALAPRKQITRSLFT